MRDPVAIVALGANTPVGRDTASSAAAVRAGICGFQEHPSMVDSAGEPMVVAMADGLDPGLPCEQRLLALLWPVLDEVLRRFTAPDTGRPLHGLARCALALALPAPRPGHPPGLAQAVLDGVTRRHANTFSLAATFASGHAAGLLGLRAAVAKFQRGELDACVLAGVDSYLNPLSLEWLESCDQLHGAGERRNAWGLVPGEGAGALVLMRCGMALDRGWPILSVVLGTGRADEPHRIKTPGVCLGEGLTRAVHEALLALPEGARVSDIYGDLNGEPYRADEYGFTSTRSLPLLASPSDIVTAADCWGDMGAAGGVLHLVLATVAGRKRHANGPLSLVWASSEGGERAAALIATGEGWGEQNRLGDAG